MGANPNLDGLFYFLLSVGIAGLLFLHPVFAVLSGAGAVISAFFLLFFYTAMRGMMVENVKETSSGNLEEGVPTSPVPVG